MNVEHKKSLEAMGSTLSLAYAHAPPSRPVDRIVLVFTIQESITKNQEHVLVRVVVIVEVAVVLCVDETVDVTVVVTVVDGDVRSHVVKEPSKNASRALLSTDTAAVHVVLCTWPLRVHVNDGTGRLSCDACSYTSWFSL